MYKKLQSQLIVKNKLLTTIPPSTHADIQTRLTTNDNLSSLTKYGDKVFMNMEAKIPTRRGYVDCEISILFNSY